LASSVSSNSARKSWQGDTWERGAMRVAVNEGEGEGVKELRAEGVLRGWGWG
jgi:hypothetical protein